MVDTSDGWFIYNSLICDFKVSLCQKIYYFYITFSPILMFNKLSKAKNSNLEIVKEVIKKILS